MDLDIKIAWVTGVSSDLGAAIPAGLICNGTKVIGLRVTQMH
ncbi:hypothetical protein [Gelidibacter salicanalis]|nr:hypothetical protein [Gelidibacter salicanalis]